MIRELAAQGAFAGADKHSLARSIVLLADWIEPRYKSVTTTYTVVDETHIGADAAGGAFTVTIPNTAETVHRLVTVKRLNSGANAVTVQLSTGTIDGAASISLTAQYQARSILLDGTNGLIVGAHL